MTPKQELAILEQVVGIVNQGAGPTWFWPAPWFAPQTHGPAYTREGRDEAVRPFLSLVTFLAHVPAMAGSINWGVFGNRQPGWWAKFSLDIEHALAWHAVQEFASVLNDVSVTERLPTRFLPTSPPPYLNGGPKEFLSWVIECEHPEFSPNDAARWLEGRFPRPVEDLSQWGQED